MSWAIQTEPINLDLLVYEPTQKHIGLLIMPRNDPGGWLFKCRIRTSEPLSFHLEIVCEEFLAENPPPVNSPQPFFFINTCYTELLKGKSPRQEISRTQSPNQLGLVSGDKIEIDFHTGMGPAELDRFRLVIKQKTNTHSRTKKIDSICMTELDPNLPISTTLRIYARSRGSFVLETVSFYMRTPVREIQSELRGLKRGVWLRVSERAQMTQKLIDTKKTPKELGLAHGDTITSLFCDFT